MLNAEDSLLMSTVANFTKFSCITSKCNINNKFLKLKYNDLLIFTQNIFINFLYDIFQ